MARREGENGDSFAMRCGKRGHVSKLEWTYLGSKDGSDYYRMTRRFPADSRDATTEAKTVRFSGQRVVVFRDAYQVVVMDPAAGKPQ